MLGIRIGLHDVFAHAIQGFEVAFTGQVQHIRDSQARLIAKRPTPSRLKQGFRRRV